MKPVGRLCQMLWRFAERSQRDLNDMDGQAKR
jgi:hypothetical protein